MRRTLSLSALAAAVLCIWLVGPAAAIERQTVSITAITTFDDVVDTFTAEGLPGCAEGTVENGNFHVQFTRTQGIFVGFKVFDCGSGTGFVLRLNAMFGPDGSVGAWSVVDAWGSVAGMHGAGGLIGTPLEGADGITDQYDGSVVL